MQSRRHREVPDVTTDIDDERRLTISVELLAARFQDMVENRSFHRSKKAI